MHFEGTDRIELVASLMKAWNARPSDGPLLTVLSAPTGFGKTRIVQEYYARLAATQQRAAVLARRARLGRRTRRPERHPTPPGPPHPNVRSAARRHLPWLWLAPPIGLLPDGSPAPALPELGYQLAAQTPASLRRRKYQGRALNAAVRGALALAPLPDLLNVAEQLYRAGSAASEAVREWQMQHGANVHGDRGGQPDGAAVLALMQELLTPRRSTAPRGESAAPLAAVLVLDDAHNLDAATTALVRNLLGTDLPVHLLATTWPSRLAAAGDEFSTLVGSLAGSPRLDIRELGRMSHTDLAACLCSRYPNTRPDIVDAFVERADGNPYALQLLLTTSRVQDSAEDGALAVAADEVRRIPNLLEELLLEHWRMLPRPRRQLLAAGASLGERVVAALVADAVASSGAPPTGHLADGEWLRALDRESRVLEFTERPRWLIAASKESEEFEDWQADAWRRHVASSLPDWLSREQDAEVLRVVRSLMIRLGRLGLMDDRTLLHDTALTLAKDALRDLRYRDVRSYLGDAETWAPAEGTERTVDRLLLWARLVRLEESAKAGRAHISAAERLIQEHLAGTELGISVLAEYALRFRIPAGEDDIHTARRAVDLATAWLRDRPDAAADVRFAVLDADGSVAGREGRYDAAVAIFAELLRLREDESGADHERTLDCLRDLAFWTARQAPGTEIPLREEHLRRTVRRCGSDEDLRVTGAQSNLAYSLMRAGGPDHLARAIGLVDAAIATRARILGPRHFLTALPRSVRVAVLLATGIAIERSRGAPMARATFREAESEARFALEVRQETGGYNLARAHRRLAEALACLREDRALEEFERAVAAHDTQPTADFAESYVWACRRLGRRGLAHEIAQAYGVPVDSRPDFDPRPPFRPGTG